MDLVIFSLYWRSGPEALHGKDVRGAWEGSWGLRNMERLGLEPKTREILQNSSKLDATCICYFRFCSYIMWHWLLQLFHLNGLPILTFFVLEGCNFGPWTVAWSFSATVLPADFGSVCYWAVSILPSCPDLLLRYWRCLVQFSGHPARGTK